ncbi:hypothetical protein LCGC14_2510350 [marine sediment metagenome]|uniref:Uncharacterized protein n=1 Tax=marine sediment metagenome TaxID=412755 RepID=A0A0F9DSS3_9ZZZZ
MNTLKDLQRWAYSIGKFSSEANIHVHTGSFDLDRVHFYIYTNEHQYSISANVKEGGRSYLGCISNNRKPRAGEDWTRGSDLIDGDLSLETWNRILGDIVSYELVKIHRKQPQIINGTPEGNRVRGSSVARKGIGC